MRRLAVLIALGSSGCAIFLEPSEVDCEVLEEAPDGYPVSECLLEIQGLNLVRGNSSHTINGGHFELAFIDRIAGIANASIGDLDAILAAGSQNAELHSGIAWRTMPGQSAHSHTSMAGPPEIVVSSSALVALQLEFNFNGEIGGSPLYTVHPDGRVHRSEQFSSGLPLDFVTAYVGLDPQKLDTVMLPDGGERTAFSVDASLFDEFFTGDPESSELCAFSQNGSYLTWASTRLAIGDDVEGQLRATDNRQVGPSIRALQSDWIHPPNAAQMGDFTASILMHLGASTDAPCADVAVQTQAFRDPGPFYDPASGIIEFTAVEPNFAPIVVDRAHPSPTFRILQLNLPDNPTITVERADRELLEGRDYIFDIIGFDLLVHLATGLNADDPLEIRVD